MPDELEGETVRAAGPEGVYGPEELLDAPARTARSCGKDVICNRAMAIKHGLPLDDADLPDAALELALALLLLLLDAGGHDLMWPVTCTTAYASLPATEQY